MTAESKLTRMLPEKPLELTRRYRGDAEFDRVLLRRRLPSIGFENE